MEKIIIELTERENNWKANLKDNPNNQSFGRTSAEALGELILSHQSYFESLGIHIERID